ncbi:MAG: hypothetical protein ACXQS3_01770 [Candidatus Methanofastidiosia archaeon]
MSKESDLYKKVKDPYQEDEDRLSAVDELGKMNTKDAKEYVYKLANDGYLKETFRLRAYDYATGQLK